MRLVFAGTPEVAVPSLRAVLASHHDVVAVVTRPDSRSGRGRSWSASAVADVAVEAGVEVLKPVTSRDPDLLARLAQLAPDCCPVVAYGGLVPPAALEIPAHGWVNLHFSLLPAWRGAAPVPWAILAGDEVTGATAFRLVDELDAGPTYGLLTETIKPDDTAGALLVRLAEHGAGLLLTTLDRIEDGTVQARPQPTDGVSWAPKLGVVDARVHWDEPAFAIDRRIRACTPAPGAWTTMAGSRLKVSPVRLRPDEVGLAAGQLVVSKSDVLVGTRSHAVELADVQAPGKPWMRAADWARGLRGAVSRLGD